MNIKIQIVPIGDKKFIAVTNISGITLRGQLAADKGGAIRNLCYKLSGMDGQQDDAIIATELLANGVDIEEQLKLADGGGDGEPK